MSAGEVEKEPENLSKPVPRLPSCLLVLNTEHPRWEVQEVVMEFIFRFRGESVLQCLRAWNWDLGL